jgi:hypothetical protein
MYINLYLNQVRTKSKPSHNIRFVEETTKRSKNIKKKMKKPTPHDTTPSYKVGWGNPESTPQK